MLKYKIGGRMKFKKNSFMQGAFIATLGIVLTKILGIVYVIPFYSIVGSRGGALYAYAYNVYEIFLGISSAGIPLAMSKIVSEYLTEGNYYAKERVFKIGKLIANLLAICSFIILIVFAPSLAKLIIGNVTGGNSIDDIVFVIRIIATAILIIPSLSIYKGYLQGHKFMSPSAISQVLEQIVRVFIIIVGSYLAMKIFHLPLKMGVGIAVGAATIGALVSYVYIRIKTKKNKQALKIKKEDLHNKKVKDKEIIGKLLLYALPFIIIDTLKPLYNSIDMVTLVKTLVNHLGYTTTVAEGVMSVISTWGNKINMIIVAISTGIITALIPSLTSSLVKKDMKSVRDKINSSFQMMIFVTIPATIGISVLAKPIWMVFYGNYGYCASVLAFSIFIALFNTTFTMAISIIQILKEYKMVVISLASGILFKLIFNVPNLYLFNKLGLEAYYGSIFTTIVGYFIGLVILLSYLNKKYEVDFKETYIRGAKILFSSLIMLVIIVLLQQFLPVVLNSRLLNVLLIGGYAIIGIFVYFALTSKFNLIDDIFGKNTVKNILKKLKLKK